MRAPFAESIMLLSSVSVATAVELFASVRIKYRLVAISIHSKALDKIMSLARMVRRDITRNASMTLSAHYFQSNDRCIVIGESAAFPATI
jgi:hypothetical protein